MTEEIPYICMHLARCHILRKYEDELVAEAKRIHEERKAKDRGEQKTMTEMLEPE